MPKVIIFLLAIVVVAWLVKRLLRIFLNVAVARSPHTAQREAEFTTVEEANWFGKTGLDESVERELPRYLRRELGEYLSDPHALKASDLRYLGMQTDARGSAHFWAMPERNAEMSFAYAQMGEKGEVVCLGWGDWSPPGGDVQANSRSES